MSLEEGAVPAWTINLWTVSIQLVSPTSGESSTLNLIQRKMSRGHLRGLPKISVQTPSQPMLLMPETLTGQHIEGSDELSPSQPFLSALASDIATAKAVRMQGVGHLRSHHVSNQTDLIVCGCDF